MNWSFSITYIAVLFGKLFKYYFNLSISFYSTNKTFVYLISYIIAYLFNKSYNYKLSISIILRLT